MAPTAPALFVFIVTLESGAVDRQHIADENPAEDDPRRLQAALGYLFTPVVPLIILTGDSGTDHWVRRHAVQSLIWSGPFLLLLIGVMFGLIVLIRTNFLFICLLPAVLFVPFLPGALWARRVYLGDEVSIPIISGLGER